jgi:hypothetical protein
LASSPVTELQLEGEIWNCLDLWQPEPVSLEFNRRLRARIQTSERKRRVRQWQLSTFGSALAVVGLRLWSGYFSAMPERPVAGVVAQSNKYPNNPQAVTQSLADLNMLRHIDFMRP